MKEFSAQTGGRYTYVEDIVNLQELSLAFAHIFDECDNFIVSGCEVSGNRINPGYVYLNRKLRYFSGASGISSWPHYLYESNRTESVSYVSGSSKVGRNIYGCSNSTSIPTASDPLTGKSPAFITMQQTGGKRMKDAFIGKYALLLNPSLLSQTVKGTVNFSGSVNVNDVLNAKNGLKVSSGSSQCNFSFSGSDFIVSVSSNSGTVYKIRVEDGVGTHFYINNALAITIGHSKITCSIPIISNKGTFGGVAIQSGKIYNASAASDTDGIDINVVSYNGGVDYFRNTRIGNGKGKAIISVTGSTGNVDINGTVNMASSDEVGLVLKSLFAKSDNNLKKSIIWKDSNDVVIGKIGYSSDQSQSMSIVNNISNIIITGSGFIDLGPAIKENGVLLKDKYMLKEDYNQNNPVSKGDVYTKEDANKTFASKSNGLSQFITTTTTAHQLCTQIGAIDAESSTAFSRNDKFLSDMGDTEEHKKTIRNNIGAAGIEDCQKKLKDSGWCNITGGLYVRQIGNIVCVEGTLTTKHTGTAFLLPMNIDPPHHPIRHTVSFSNSKNWIVEIEADSRSCNVVYCSGSCDKLTSFLLTYLV